MTSTVKPKAKFSSRNLSAVYKAPQSKTLENAGRSGSNSVSTKGVAVDANRCRAGSYQNPNRMLVLGKVKAPAPLNTPSLRSEHQVHHPETTTTRTTWATTPSATTPSASSVTTSSAPVLETALRHPASPTAHQHHETNGENVWAAGHVAEIINPEVAHHHHEPVRAPRASPFLAASSGRWGDDAVEQDIERQARQRDLQRQREFPDLQEAAHLQEESEHDAHYRHAPPPHRGGFDRPLYDRFEGRAAGRFAPERVMLGNDPHTHFSSSDARFDSIARGEGPPFGSSRRSYEQPSHAMDRPIERSPLVYHSDAAVKSRYPSPPHYGFLPEEDRHVAAPPATRVVESGDWRRASASVQDSGADTSSQAEVHHQVKNRTPVVASRACGQPAAEPPREAERTISAADSFSSTSSSSSSVDKGQPVRILQRPGPKMLFDPKTGGMVSVADKPERAPVGNRRRQLSVSSTSSASSATIVEASVTIADEPVKKEATVQQVGNKENEVTTLLVGDVEVAIIPVDMSKPKAQSVVNESPVTVESSASEADQQEDRKTARVSSKPVKASSSTARPNQPASFDKKPVANSNGMAKSGVRRENDKNTAAKRSNRAEKSSTAPREKPVKAARAEKEPPIKPATSSKERVAKPSNKEAPAHPSARQASKHDKNSEVSARKSRRSTRGKAKPADSESVVVTDVPTPVVKPSAQVELLKQVPEGAGVVVLTAAQEGIEFGGEDFHTVKSRRTVLLERKRQREEPVRQREEPVRELPHRSSPSPAKPSDNRSTNDSKAANVKKEPKPAKTVTTPAKTVTAPAPVKAATKPAKIDEAVVEPVTESTKEGEESSATSKQKRHRGKRGREHGVRAPAAAAADEQAPVTVHRHESVAKARDKAETTSKRNHRGKQSAPKEPEDGERTRKADVVSASSTSKSGKRGPAVTESPDRRDGEKRGGQASQPTEERTSSSRRKASRSSEAGAATNGKAANGGHDSTRSRRRGGAKSAAKDGHASPVNAKELADVPPRKQPKQVYVVKASSSAPPLSAA